jgi:nucleotide-binding universal stress UspA family protein
MVKFMVGVDGSANGDNAFDMAVHLMNKREDTLIIVSVVEDLENRILGVVLDEAQRALKRECRKLLRGYRKRAKEAGVLHYHAIMGVSSHEAEFIVRLSNTRKADFIILGRRGLGTISRFFAGSTSRYVMEHATCNVLIAKQPLRERKAEEAAPAVERLAEVPRAAGAEPTRQMEEDERQRRMKEEEEMIRKEQEDRKAAYVQAVSEEEAERRRRVKEEGMREERQFKVQIYDIDD